MGTTRRTGRRRALVLAVALVAAVGFGGGCARPADVTYTYRVVGWGNTASLDEFRDAVASILDDPEGWSAGGAISFRRVDDGGDFTLYLASPANVASLSSICSVEWSCSVGRSVAINDDRWRFASAPWLAAGGNVLDYRQMVVNHEVGHWLGFDHVGCTAGQPAPVMMQQSKGVGTCLRNPRPLLWEREQAAAARGTEVRSGDPFGSLDVVARVPGGVRVGGWAIDPDTSASIVVHVHIDGVPVFPLTADGDRPDVGNVYPFYGPRHGFDGVVRTTAVPHSVCVVALNTFRSGGNPTIGCHAV